MLVSINEEFIKDLFVEKKQLVVKNMKLKHLVVSSKIHRNDINH